MSRATSAGSADPCSGRLQGASRVHRTAGTAAAAALGAVPKDKLSVLAGAMLANHSTNTAGSSLYRVRRVAFNVDTSGLQTAPYRSKKRGWRFFVSTPSAVTPRRWRSRRAGTLELLPAESSQAADSFAARHSRISSEASACDRGLGIRGASPSYLPRARTAATAAFQSERNRDYHARRQEGTRYATPTSGARWL